MLTDSLSDNHESTGADMSLTKTQLDQFIKLMNMTYSEDDKEYNAFKKGASIIAPLLLQALEALEDYKNQHVAGPGTATRALTQIEAAVASAGETEESK